MFSLMLHWCLEYKVPHLLVYRFLIYELDTMAGDAMLTDFVRILNKEKSSRDLSLIVLWNIYIQIVANIFSLDLRHGQSCNYA